MLSDAEYFPPVKEDSKLYELLATLDRFECPKNELVRQALSEARKEDADVIEHYLFKALIQTKAFAWALVFADVEAWRSQNYGKKI
jgi:hypothetical protein